MHLWPRQRRGLLRPARLRFEVGQRLDRDAALAKLVEIQYDAQRHRLPPRHLPGARRCVGDLPACTRRAPPCGSSSSATRSNPSSRNRPACAARSSAADTMATIYPGSHYVVGPRDMKSSPRPDPRRAAGAAARLPGPRAPAGGPAPRAAHDVRPRAARRAGPLQRHRELLPLHRPAAWRGQPPYLPARLLRQDWLLVVDESHVTIPQVGGMYRGDRARKETLVEYGFRLPSAIDNRPLKFDEFERLVNQAVYVSATPVNYELEKTQGVVVEQIIRPTGLVGSGGRVRPANGRSTTCWGTCATPSPRDAGARHDADQAHGRGSDRLLPRARHQCALPAQRHRHHRAHGHPARPAPGCVRRAGRHQPAARGPRPARGGPGRRCSTPTRKASCATRLR
jgi:hypothetical protein